MIKLTLFGKESPEFGNKVFVASNTHGITAVI